MISDVLDPVQTNESLVVTQPTAVDTAARDRAFWTFQRVGNSTLMWIRRRITRVKRDERTIYVAQFECFASTYMNWTLCDAAGAVETAVSGECLLMLKEVDQRGRTKRAWNMRCRRHWRVRRDSSGWNMRTNTTKTRDAARSCNLTALLSSDVLNSLRSRILLKRLR